MYNNNSRKGNQNYKAKNNGKFNGGGKKPMNNNGRKPQGKRPFKSPKKPIPQSTVYLKWADPAHYAKVIADSITENDDKLYRYIRGHLYKGYGLYTVKMQTSNAFVSGFTHKTVGYLAMNEVTVPNKRAVYVFMTYIPTNEVLDSAYDNIINTEFAAYKAGNALMAACGIDTIISISGTRDQLDKLAKANGFNPIDAFVGLVDIFGENAGTDADFNVYASRNTGVKIAGNGAFYLTVDWMKVYFAEHLNGYTFSTRGNQTTITNKTGDVCVLFNRCEKNESGQRVIKYACDEILNGRVKSLIEAGIEYENSCHHSPFDPAEKIKIEKVSMDELKPKKPQPTPKSKTSAQAKKGINEVPSLRSNTPKYSYNNKKKH